MQSQPPAAPAASNAGLSDSSAGGPSAALLLARGICRALGKSGDLVIIEIKSSVADFRADRKWTGYREFADRLYFAVPNELPAILIPEECGLTVADAFGAALLRDGITTPLPAARRRAMTLRFAQAAAARLRRQLDPQAALLGEAW